MASSAAARTSPAAKDCPPEAEGIGAARPAMGAILWLASYPKSGNTWLRAFLANLLAGRREPVPLAELPSFCDDEALPERFTAAAGRPSTELSLGEIAALRPRVHAAIAASVAGTVLVKTHNCAGAYDGHPLHNPTVTAGAIYVVRNPLDLVLSMAHHFDLTVDAAIDWLASDDAATANDDLFVSQVLGSWTTHVASWTGAADSADLVLRYEDLLDRPLEQFTRVARLVGLGTDPRRISRAVRHASFATLAAMERRDGFIEATPRATAFFRQGSAQQWRIALNPAQVERVVAAHREQMKELGYLP